MELQYLRPLPRSQHRAVFYEDLNEIFMYGGMGYPLEQPFRYDISYPTTVKSDMWYFNLYHCTNNCSFHGECHFGFCRVSIFLCLIGLAYYTCYLVSYRLLW